MAKPPTSVRSVAIAGLFLLLLLGQAYAVVARDEVWPFSPYPMYADTQGSQVFAVQVEGRSAAGETYPVSIRGELSPFDPSRLLGFFRRLSRGRDADERGHAAARALLALYETRREQGRNGGPELTELSIYESSWRIAPDAKNRDRPNKRRLIATTRAGER